jgi:hypothetical protein
MAMVNVQAAICDDSAESSQTAARSPGRVISAVAAAWQSLHGRFQEATNSL